MMPSRSFCLFVLGLLYQGNSLVHSFSATSRTTATTTTTTLQSTKNSNEFEDASNDRRTFISSLAVVGAAVFSSGSQANAVTRAIGGAEAECRAAGNCLEIGEIDGALGWNWGGTCSRIVCSYSSDVSIQLPCPSTMINCFFFSRDPPSDSWYCSVCL